MKHHFIGQAIEAGEVLLKFYKSEEQLVDIFTEALLKEKFEQLKEIMGVLPLHIKGEF